MAYVSADSMALEHRVIWRLFPLGEQWDSTVTESKISASRRVQPFDIGTRQSLLTTKLQAPQWSDEVNKKESLVF